MVAAKREGRRYVVEIQRSGLTIYDHIDVGDERLWIPTEVLEELLGSGLAGLSLRGLPLRTRSKVVKEAVCRVLGYPVPMSFKKTRPRFPGQAFDTYIQKADNLQVWNDEVSPERRYVVIRVSEDDAIGRVRVVTGDVLARLDTTGTLTQKYQARYVRAKGLGESALADTSNLSGLLTGGEVPVVGARRPTDDPAVGELLPVSVIFEQLGGLVGNTFEDAGPQQDRSRGSRLHQLVSSRLGYREYHDDGRFPDIRHQLLEVKLQTSPTIDLGLVRPDSEDALEMPLTGGQRIRHCDVRYAVFGAKTDGKNVSILAVDIVTGERFFERFPQFRGKVLNKKLQIPLPRDFFSGR